MPIQRVTFPEREQIEMYVRMKKKKTWIAEKLKRDLSVIKREIRRNSSEHLPYTARSAQIIADRHAKKTNTKKLEKEKHRELKKFVEASLRKGHSPEQIAGRIRVRDREHSLNEKDGTVCAETIYQYIYTGSGRMGGFFKCLRRKQKVRTRRFGRKTKKTLIPSRVSIHERPKAIGERKRYGDWETDSVIFSKQESVLSVQNERKIRLCRLTKAKNKTADESERAIRKHLSKLPEKIRRSMTRDNGTENVLHEETKRILNLPSYFCDTYASWQKGGVENMNGLIREYLPRKCAFDSMTDKEIFEIQERLNNRPRKCLGYKTPNEVFAEVIAGK